jgi:hypothetical protein
MDRPGWPDLDSLTSAVGYVSDTGGVTLIAREYVALPGGGIKRVYSVEQADGSVTLSDHEAWLASRAARCSCGRICCGRGRTCGQPECIARLASV